MAGVIGRMISSAMVALGDAARECEDAQIFLYVEAITFVFDVLLNKE